MKRSLTCILFVVVIAVILMPVLAAQENKDVEKPAMTFSVAVTLAHKKVIYLIQNEKSSAPFPVPLSVMKDWFLRIIVTQKPAEPASLILWNSKDDFKTAKPIGDEVAARTLEIDLNKKLPGDRIWLWVNPNEEIPPAETPPIVDVPSTPSTESEAEAVASGPGTKSEPVTEKPDVKPEPKDDGSKWQRFIFDFGTKCPIKPQKKLDTLIWLPAYNCSVEQIMAQPEDVDILILRWWQYSILELLWDQIPIQTSQPSVRASSARSFLIFS